MILVQKYLVFTIFTIFFSVILNAQEVNSENTPKTKSDFWNRVHFGGSIGLGFSSDYTNVAISPSGVYQFNDQFSGGLALGGNYSSRKDYFEATVLSASLVGLFNPIRELQISAEFEQNNVSYNNKIIDESTNYWYPALYLGGGYTIGDFGAIGMRYDVLYNDKKSVYGSALSPFVRVYF